MKIKYNKYLKDDIIRNKLSFIFGIISICSILINVYAMFKLHNIDIVYWSGYCSIMSLLLMYNLYKEK